MVFAGPASDRIFVLQIVTFVVLTGPATDEILEPQFERFLGLAGPATGEILELQIVRHMVFAGPATDESLELLIVRLWSSLGLPQVKFWNSRLVGLWFFCWACHGCKFRTPKCKACGRRWACLGLPPTQFWTSSLRFFRSMHGLPLPWTDHLARFGALVCSMNKIRWLCWPHRLALVCLFCAVPSFSGSEMIWLDPLVGLSWCCCSLWNEWDLHVYVFCRNECCSHVRRAVVL